jgi:para-nitrobenzyl esterase
LHKFTSFDSAGCPLLFLCRIIPLSSAEYMKIKPLTCLLISMAIISLTVYDNVSAQSLVKKEVQYPKPLVAAALVNGDKASAGLLTRQIESGFIKGYYNKNTNVYAFKGIPFAAPPVGNLRWKAPQPAIPWKGIKDCQVFGPSPMQPKPASFLMIGPEFVIPPEPLSEDCLYLNVWTAAESKEEKRPVLVWIYGGGFQTGGSAAPGYSGEALAQQGIVFVSFNYRLGVFGFLSHPELTTESGHQSSGNYALLDQIAVLKWVKKNIHVFGGDPDRVTIAGQSAGSAIVNCLLVSPLARGLFHGAIGESGSLVLENPILRMRSLEDAEKDGERMAKKLNAPNLISLRALTADELQQKATGFFSPIVDGYIMPNSVKEFYKKGNQAHVPLMTGWNSDEGFLFGIAGRENFAKQAAGFGADSILFKKYFPAQTDSESASSQNTLSVDKTMGLSEYEWALKQNENNTAKTFLYVFTRKPPAEGNLKQFGAYHTAEIGYALHNLDSIQRPWQPVDRRLEKLMSAYWVQFVKTGDPNLPGLPMWDAFSHDNPQTMIFSDSSKGRPLPDKAALDFLYTHYPGN